MNHSLITCILEFFVVDSQTYHFDIHTYLFLAIKFHLYAMRCIFLRIQQIVSELNELWWPYKLFSISHWRGKFNISAIKGKNLKKIFYYEIVLSCINEHKTFEVIENICIVTRLGSIAKFMVINSSPFPVEFYVIVVLQLALHKL